MRKTLTVLSLVGLVLSRIQHCINAPPLVVRGGAMLFVNLLPLLRNEKPAPRHA